MSLSSYGMQANRMNSFTCLVSTTVHVWKLKTNSPITAHLPESKKYT